MTPDVYAITLYQNYIDTGFPDSGKHKRVKQGVLVLATEAEAESFAELHRSEGYNGCGGSADIDRVPGDAPLGWTPAEATDTDEPHKETLMAPGTYPDTYGACIVCGAARGLPCDTLRDPGTPRSTPHFYRATGRPGDEGPQGRFVAVRDEPNYGEAPAHYSESEATDEQEGS